MFDIIKTVKELRHERQRKLEREIEKQRAIFEEVNHKKLDHMKKYHILQATYMSRYGHYYRFGKEKQLSIQRIRDIDDYNGVFYEGKWK